MHPVEYLRSVARSRTNDSIGLTVDFLYGLRALSDDAAALVMACRQMLNHHPEVAQLWWASSSVLTSIDPGIECERCVATIEDDPTWEIAHDAVEQRFINGSTAAFLTFGMSENGVLLESQEASRLRHANQAWLVAPEGTVLPPALFAAQQLRCSETLIHVELHNFQGVLGPNGLIEPKVAAFRNTCAVAAELLETGA